MPWWFRDWGGDRLRGVNADELMPMVLFGSALFAGLVLLVVLGSRRTVAGWLVGGAGVLMGAQVGGVHVFTIATVVWVLFTPKGRHDRDGRALLLVGSAVLLSTSVLFGDLVNSRTLALQLVALAFNAAMIAVRAEAQDVAAMLRGALVVITVGGVVGLLQVFGVIPLELWHINVSSIGRPTGIWPEPDWMGLMGALGLVLAWRLPLAPLTRVVCLSVSGASFVLAFARAAWVALAVCVVVALVAGALSRRREKVAGRGRVLAVVVLLVVGVVGLTASPELRSDLGRRVDSLTSSAAGDVSGQARVQQIEGLLFLSESALPFGHGLSASGRVGVSGRLLLSGDSPNNVASNWILALWVDGALLALPLIGFLLYFALRGVRLLPGQLLVVVLVNSLFSNAVFMPVAWLVLGLAMQALERPKRQAPIRPERLDPVERDRRRLVLQARRNAETAAGRSLDEAGRSPRSPETTRSPPG